MSHNYESYSRDMIAGGLAGFVVDISLFPIDTIKTRFQSKAGFVASGGFRNIYRGLPVVSAGSVPGSAVFFSTYEAIRRTPINIGNASSNNKQLEMLKNSIIAPSVGECAACVVRVPVEVVKQRAQATGSKSAQIIRNIMTRQNSEKT